ISLVFIDPPYDIPEMELTTTLDLLIPWLTPDALVIVERSSRSPQPTWPAALVLENTSTWGETAAYFAGPPPTTP
ncbi:MAG: RsmD family RNA methyltransferase, partial [Actinomycetaceae bacterium]|nr:RsmD family RNA methyltransferase [Actinomycetaceae bacterium]